MRMKTNWENGLYWYAHWSQWQGRKRSPFEFAVERETVRFSSIKFAWKIIASHSKVNIKSVELPLSIEYRKMDEIKRNAAIEATPRYRLHTHTFPSHSSIRNEFKHWSRAIVVDWTSATQQTHTHTQFVRIYIMEMAATYFGILFFLLFSVRLSFDSVIYHIHISFLPHSHHRHTIHYRALFAIWADFFVFIL